MPFRPVGRGWMLAGALCALLGRADGGAFTGAAVVDEPAGAIIAWGDGVTVWPLSGASPLRYLQGRRFGAGCAGRDGVLYLLEGARLVMASPPYAGVTALESDTEFQDCLAWTMNGRRGVLIPHRHMQLRFYSPAETPVDLYSIYTPSMQGGLMEADVDRDGRQDLLWGNYWLRRPIEAEAHWRLFAINLFFELPDSALARLALTGNGDLYWGAASGEPRLTMLKPGPDPTQLWTAEPLPDPPRRLAALLAIDGGLIAAHAAGIEIYTRRRSGWTKRTLDARPAAALMRTGGDVWALFDDGPRIVYRLK